MKIALVHDWVVTLGGAERCLESFHQMYPDAPLYTLVYDPQSVERLGFLPGQVHASFLQRMPRAAKWYTKYAPLYPLAIEGFDLGAYDVIISSSHAAAKGVLVRADQIHICYCYTPMRYAWDLTHQYLRDSGLHRGLKGALGRFMLHYLRMWDLGTSNRVDRFVAISNYVARRIWRTYRRDAQVIYPPVDVNRFRADRQRDDFFLFVSRLVPYKRADLVVDAFTQLGLPLVVIGDGAEAERVSDRAGKNITFMGRQSDDVVKDYMERCRALVFAADEDFGIVPVEAQAAGAPVIAYGKGGVLETVVGATGDNWETATGIFFEDQNVQSITEAVKRFVSVERFFLRKAVRQNAERFDRLRFNQEIADLVDKVTNERGT